MRIPSRPNDDPQPGTGVTLQPAAPNVAVRHLTQSELAARWRMSPRTLERWRSTGHGPAFLKLGGGVVYSVADVAAYEIAQRRAANAKADQRLSGGEKFARGLPAR